jgi:hypothetical protein
MLSVIMLIIVMLMLNYCYAECHYADYGYAVCHYADHCYAECHYADYRYAVFTMLSVIMLSIVMLCVMLIVVILSGVVPNMQYNIRFINSFIIKPLISYKLFFIKTSIYASWFE